MSQLLVFITLRMAPTVAVKRECPTRASGAKMALWRALQTPPPPLIRWQGEARPFNKEHSSELLAKNAGGCDTEVAARAWPQLQPMIGNAAGEERVLQIRLSWMIS